MVVGGKKIMKIAHQHIILTLLFVIALTACSKQSWYQGAQSSQHAHCMKEPLSEYEECMRQSDESYQNYEKKREDLIKDSATK